MGCITNVASAILIDPSIIGNIVVVWLGGNSLESPHQREFNLMQDIVHSPILTDQVTYSTDMSRHFIRMATSVNRDAIFRDLFVKIGNAGN